MAEEVSKEPKDARSPDPVPFSAQPGNSKPEPAEPERPESASAPPGGGNAMDIKLGGPVSAKEFDIANVITKTKNTVNNYFPDKQGIASVVIKQFSFSDIWRISNQSLSELRELFVGDAAEIERQRFALTARRVLILSGEARLGKTATAVYLSTLLSTDNALNHEHAESLAVHVIPPQDRHLKIDLDDISSSPDFGNRVTIFKNAVARGNLDLRNTVMQLDEFSLTELAAKLRDNNSYLIFTLTTTQATQLLSETAKNELQHEMKSLTRELLMQGLERRLSYLAKTAKSKGESFAGPGDEQLKSTLIVRLKTMPRIAGFLGYCQRNSLTIETEFDLEQALAQFETISHWFQSLTDDFHSWCFTLSLGLAQCSRDPQPVRWVDFECLRRAVTECLKNDRELFPSRVSSEGPPAMSFSETKPRLTDELYLEKSGAIVCRDGNNLGDSICFRDQTYPSKLWEILLKNYRRVLMILLPKLTAMAEDHDAEDGWSGRELCAEIIGRIGEIDPERVTLNLINRWTSSENINHRVAVAGLYEGILASQDERYRSYFLEVLESLSNASGTDGDSLAEKDQVLTSIAVYSRIGIYDLPLAMGALKRIASARLAPVLADMQRIGRLIERTQNAFAKELSERDALEVLIFEDLLNDLAYRLYAEQASTFVGVQYAFTSLCLSTDTISVFKELRTWMESSNQANGVLVALMFLMKDGIGSTLESVKVQVTKQRQRLDAPSTCNPIIASLKSGRESVIEMARFLVGLFEAFDVRFVLPREFKSFLRESFMFHLTSWVDEGLRVEDCPKEMESLFEELMRIHNRILYKPIDNLFRSRTFLKNEPVLKRAFVNAVLWPIR